MDFNLTEELYHGGTEFTEIHGDLKKFNRKKRINSFNRLNPR